MVQLIADAVFVVLLVVGVPLVSWMSMRDPLILTLPRLRLYASAVLSEWIFTALAIVAVKIAGLGANGVGLRGVSLESFTLWTVALAAISAAGLGLLLILEQRGWWPDEPELVYLLIPRTAREKAWALVLVAPTAALVEEFVYRGYLFAILARALNSIGWAWVLSSAAFGLAHLYQRPNGMIRAAVMGALLAWPVVQTGSLYPAIAAHFLIDAAALGWLGPRMLKVEPAS